MAGRATSKPTGSRKVLKRCKESGTISHCPGLGRLSQITSQVKSIVEEQMHIDDETTALQLHHLLQEKGYHLSHWTILRSRTSLGWTFRGSAYCPFIRQQNKLKHLEWARNDDFENIVWTDECSVQLETQRRFSCRKRGERPVNNPRYVYVNV